MIPDNLDWDDIRKVYEKARYCLKGHDRDSGWHRDESNGMFYLWTAYHYAVAASEKGDVDHALYAEILILMTDELRINVHDYDLFHKYVNPALHEYESAVQAGQKISNKGYETIKWANDKLKYELDHESDYSEESWAEAVSLIENGQLLDEKLFSFHDSKVVFFQQTFDKEAVMKLQYDKQIATLRFLNLDHITIDTDPLMDWISDFYCYRTQNSNFRIFNIGYYNICSERIILDGITENEGLYDLYPEE